MNNLELQKHANDVRKGIVTAVHSAKAGHPGGSLSAADVFTFLRATGIVAGVLKELKGLREEQEKAALTKVLEV